MIRAQSRIKVLIDTPAHFIRPRNTDWLYMKVLAGLSKFAPLDISFSHSLADTVEESAHYIAGRLAPRRKLGADEYRRSGRHIAAQAKNADVVLCHRRFPMDTNRPVVWQHAVLDPRMTVAAGARAESVAQAYANQGAVYAIAAAVQVSTKAEADRHAAAFPDLVDRFHAVPFFLPHIRALSDSDVIAKHQNEDVVRILFVGREGRRKGLDLLLDAVLALPDPILGKIRLDVVSKMDGKSVSIPSHPAIHVHAELSRGEVLGLMRSAHIFAMPSRYESYGFTFVEAMANGCAVVGPDWEVQVELLDHGNAGVNVAPRMQPVLNAIGELCSNQQERCRIARAALARYQNTYAPNVVVKAYYEMIERAVSHGEC